MQQGTNLAEVRQEVFGEVFDEFAFLSLREHAPELLVVMMEGMFSDQPVNIAPFDPYRFSKVFVAGAARYVATGKAQAFYEEGKSLMLSKLTLCSLCRNGEHERCYVDSERFLYCVCVCSSPHPMAITMVEEPASPSPVGWGRNLVLAAILLVVVGIVAGLIYFGG